MDYTVLDLDTDKRKQHFKYFSGLAFPYVGTTAPVDITALMEKIRREGLPFSSHSATTRRGRRTACRNSAGAS